MIIMGEASNCPVCLKLEMAWKTVSANWLMSALVVLTGPMRYDSVLHERYASCRSVGGGGQQLHVVFSTALQQWFSSGVPDCIP